MDEEPLLRWVYLAVLGFMLWLGGVPFWGVLMYAYFYYVFVVKEDDDDQKPKLG